MNAAIQLLRPALAMLLVPLTLTGCVSTYYRALGDEPAIRIETTYLPLEITRLPAGRIQGRLPYREGSEIIKIGKAAASNAGTALLSKSAK